MKGLAFTVAADAMGSDKSVGFHATAAGVVDDVPQQVQNDSTRATKGKQYKTVVARTTAKPSTEIDDNDNWNDNTWSIPNTFDLSALGARSTGAPGSTVTIRVGVKNTGKGTVANTRSGDSAAAFTFVTPTGTEVVSAPTFCYLASASGLGDGGTPGGQTYRCYPPSMVFTTGASVLVEFSLKITQAVTDATGKVTLYDPYTEPASQHKDSNASNDEAAVLINPSGASIAANPILPVTGTSITLVATGGTALVGVGVALFLITRRRRIRLVAPDTDLAP